MHTVFISHSSEDKAIADDICTLLEANDIKCWIAPRDEKAGVKYSGQLAEAVKASKILVVTQVSQVIKHPCHRDKKQHRDFCISQKMSILVVA